MGFLYSGGGERVVLEQTKRLRARGHKVKLFSPIIRWKKSFPKMLQSVNPERIVPPFPLPFPFREASAMLASSVFPFRMREIADCDILLCHSQPSMWLGYRTNQMFGTPYVGYLHQLTSFIHKRPEVAGNWATKGDFLMLDGLLGVFCRGIAKQLDMICHKTADALLFNSFWTRRQFEKTYSVTGQVCYPAIQMPPHRVVSGRQNMVITASRHYPWKRIDLAFHVLRHSKASPDLNVVGERTNYTPTLVSIARDLGLQDRVKFTGFLSEAALHSVYTSAKVYVQTSIHEPFGLAPLEAQSYGAPAIVWGDAGGRETVLDGETGFYAKPYDVSDFGLKLDRIMADRQTQKSMSRSAQTWATEFSWDAHIDLLEGVLDERRR